MVHLTSAETKIMDIICDQHNDQNPDQCIRGGSCKHGASDINSDASEDKTSLRISLRAWVEHGPERAVLPLMRFGTLYCMPAHTQ